MGLLSSEDKEKIKRAIPKGSNKIIYATVAKLYIAYPDPDNYLDTGLSGAIVLVDDTVGKTFFIKLVDIYGQRGVIWDQELSVNFDYHKDRTFFHSFELEEFCAGLLFEDISEANHFFKRVTNKEKYGSKHTVHNKNAFAAKNKAILDEQNKQSVAGPRGFNNIDIHDPNNAQKIRRAKNIIYYNDQPPPEWRELYKVLDEEEGINESLIAENREFIKEYVRENGPQTLIGLEPPIPRKYQYGSSNNNTSNTARISSTSSFTKKKKAPPPLPPPGAAAASSNASSAAATPSPTPTPPALPSKSPSEEPQTQEKPERKFKLPPAPTFMGEGLKNTPVQTQNVPFNPIPQNGSQTAYQQSHRQDSYQQYQQQQTTAAINAVPPPPLPPKTPPASSTAPTKYSVPPPLQNRSTPPLPMQTQNRPPPPLSRGNVPQPALPSRPSLPPRVPLASGQNYIPQFGQQSGVAQLTPTPPAPPRAPYRPSVGGLQPQHTSPAPPPPPSRKIGASVSGGNAGPPPPPPSRKPFASPQPPPVPPQQQPPVPSQQPPSSFAAVHQQLQNKYSQPFPLPQPSTPSAAPTPAAAAPPPPPAMPPFSSAPQAPPPPPMMLPPSQQQQQSAYSSTHSAPEPPTGDAGRDALLASIRGAGIGNLKRVDKSQIKHF